MNLSVSRRTCRTCRAGLTATRALAGAYVLLVGLIVSALCAAPSAFAQPQVHVGQFRPDVNGLHFANAFSEIPHFTITVGTVQVPIGNAANGMCGGMVYTVRDYYESGFPVPVLTDPPTGGPLYDYIVDRLYASFGLPGGPLKYMHLMDPALPDHETDLSRAGLAPHGRAWVMIVDEWPLIKADLDAQVLSPVALVRVKSLDPFQLGHNHQVLAYGYSLQGWNVRVYVYDPNHPNDNDVYFEFSTQDPQHTTDVAYVADGVVDPDESMNCFFHTDYGYSTPPPGATHVDAFSGCLAPNGAPSCTLGTGGAFPKVSQGANAAPSGGIILIRTGAYPERLTFTKPAVLRPWGGSVRIGPP